MIGLYYISTIRPLGGTPDAAAIDRISRLRIAPRASGTQAPLAAWLDMTLKTVDLKKAFVPMIVAPAIVDAVVAAGNADHAGSADRYPRRNPNEASNVMSY